MIILCLLCYTCLLLLFRRGFGRSKAFAVSACLLGAWLLLLGVLGERGFFQDFSKLPPRPGLALLLPLPWVWWFAASTTGKAFLEKVPPQWIIFLQSFRIGVEILLWIKVSQGLLPVQMSFEGRNFDILSGLLALPVGYYCFVRRRWPSWVVLVYNIIGLLLLLNIIVIAVLSMPTPLRVFHNEPANTLVGHFPFVFLPGFLVPLAYTLHIFSIRQWMFEFCK